MKCPKCGYLGFETSERCRNCGYDFSLSVDVSPASELPLYSSEGPGTPLADFDLSGVDTRVPEESISGLDLNRLIGDTPESVGPVEQVQHATRVQVERPGKVGKVGPPGPASPAAPVSPTSPPVLPLFSGADDDTPLITAPRPVRPPLSVRRTTPEIPRGRTRTPNVTRRANDDALALDIAPAAATSQSDAVNASLAEPPAGTGARLLATLIDIALLGGINAVVVYLTLALSGLGMDQVRVLPILPIVSFLAILDAGYLIAFIAASGQTIGKMITRIKVMGDDGQRVDIASAGLRAAGCALSLLTIGLGYLPAFVTADGRALQDRISRTRVVSAR